MITGNPGCVSRGSFNIWENKALIACVPCFLWSQVISCGNHSAALSSQGHRPSELPHTCWGESPCSETRRHAGASTAWSSFTTSTQTMVQACLYPLGRSAEVFEDPQRFDPGRWGRSREEGQRGGGTGFRSLAFGFGARQCVGRRIAENEMQLLLMHVGDRGNPSERATSRWVSHSLDFAV